MVIQIFGLDLGLYKKLLSNIVKDTAQDELNLKRFLGG